MPLTKPVFPFFASWITLYKYCLQQKILYTNIDQTHMNSLHGLLNCEIGGLECHVITTEYRTLSIVYTCIIAFYWPVKYAYLIRLI